MADFTPRATDFEARVRASFACQAAMASIGAEIVSVVPGRVVLAMPVNPDFTQQHGFLHAGTLTSVLDSACGYAAFSLMPDDAAVLTAEFKVSLLAPARGARFECTGQVMKAGRTLTFTEGRAVALDDGRETLIAAMSATMMTVQGRADVRG